MTQPKKRARKPTPATPTAPQPKGAKRGIPKGVASPPVASPKPGHSGTRRVRKQAVAKGPGRKSHPKAKKPESKQTSPAAPAPPVPAKQPAPLSPPVAAKPAVEPIKVDGRNRRSDSDALEGGFAQVVKGKHAGRHGTFDQVIETDDDGWPKVVIVLTRDERNERLRVNYSDLRPDTAGRR